MSLSQFKTTRTSVLDKLSDELNKTASKKYGDDERFWKVTTDKAGNGSAIIRFLPAKGDESEIPWVSYYSHSFQGPGGWYIENCLTTINQDDPSCEYNTKLFESGVEDNKTLGRKQKRKLHYVSNILVVKDPAHPENEGKVFLFRYGSKIFGKIKELMQPEQDELTEEEVTPIYPFQPYSGANFKLVVRKEDGYPNYDKSVFLKQSAIAPTDEEIDAIGEKLFDLKEFVDPKNFKSYDALKKRLDKVLGLSAKAPSEEKRPSVEEKRASAPQTRDEDDNDEVSGSVEEDDENLSYLQKLAEDD